MAGPCRAGSERMEWTTITLADHKFQLYKDVAQTAVAKLTFHNLNKVKAYFDAMLTTPPDWPRMGHCRN